MGVSVGVRLEVQLGGVWTNVTSDTVAVAGLRMSRGIRGSSPHDVVAGSGELAATLRNDAGNSGAQQGWYSPLHASVRSGWAHGVNVRLIFTYAAIDYTVFTGKVRAIDPEPGRYRSQRVAVTAYDIMRDLAETDVRQVGVQVNQTEAQLLTAVIAALPASAQPAATNFDAGVDLFPYAFADLGGGVKALTLIKDIAVSSFARVFATGNGTLRMINRHKIATAVSAHTFTDSMHGLSVPSSLDQVFNRVRVTIRPLTIDAAATTVLYALRGTPPSLASGETRDFWGSYVDPNDSTRSIGGLDVVTALVAGTDYAANAAENGSGADLTASVSIVCTAFASSVKFSVTNNGSQAVYLVTTGGVTKLQVRGRGVYDDAPQTFESASAGTADRPLDIEMLYQDDSNVAQSAADYLKAQYGSLTGQIEALEFMANVSDAFMVQALAREIGDRITVSETVTGVSTDAILQSIDYELMPGNLLRCRWGLAPVSAAVYWQWGIVGASEWGESTVYGF